jgi:retron-type reverse transcriptase
MDSSHYNVFRIPKKHGFREIAEPLPELKQEQRNILKWLVSRGIQSSKFAHGFTNNRSIKTNAIWHIGRAVVVKMDIKDFFPSVKRRRIVAVLMEEGVDAETAEYIAERCTLDSRLPQGAPTSPFLANIVLKKMDFRLAGLVQKKCSPFKGFYTRYADDLCFSSDYAKLNELIPAIANIISAEGFKINPSKTRVMRRNHRQIVTGVVVNEKPNIAREKRRNFRAELHNQKKKIIYGHVPKPGKLAQLQGMVGYFLEVSPYHGRKFRQDLREIKRLIALNAG